MENDINVRIRKYRKAKKMTQEELGNALGMKCSTYSQMERKGKITVGMAQKIADILDVDPDMIMYGEKTTSLPFPPPIENPPLKFADSSNPFDQSKSNGPEIITAYKSGEFLISVEETRLIKELRHLSLEQQREVAEFITACRLKNKN